MGLLDWLRGSSAKGLSPGPTPDGIYGVLPSGSSWESGTDPAGDPQRFVPEPDDLTFDLVDWEWQKFIKATALGSWRGKELGFMFLFVLSDGSHRDSVEIYKLGRSGKPELNQKREWLVPAGHPTREVALMSLGETTTNLVRRLEECFQYPATKHESIPAKNARVCQMVVLRGKVIPSVGHFTARLKLILPAVPTDANYGEFFLNVNSLTKKAWVSEKSSNYRNSILNFMTA